LKYIQFKMDLGPVGGLSHLVEAATALTKLVEVRPPQSDLHLKPQILPSPYPPPSTVQIQQRESTPTEESTHLQQQQQEQPQQRQSQEQQQKTVVSDDDEELKRMESSSSKTTMGRSTSSSLLPSTSSTLPVNTSREIFPQRLMKILADKNLSDVISWLPHGRSFVIIRPDVFSERVLPQYFLSTDSRSSTKYPSFTRKLNRWGFRQATRGPDTGAFLHPSFRRDQPQKCLEMVCQKSRKRGSSSSMKGSKSSLLRSSLVQIQGNAELSSFERPKAVTPNKLFLQQPHRQTTTFGAPVLTTTVPLTKEALATLATMTNTGSQLSLTNKNRSTVSLDDRSISSTSCSTLPINTLNAVLPTVNAPLLNFVNTNNFVTTAPMVTAVSPWIPQNPNLIAATLRLREEKERLCVAKSMLYAAYLTALKN